MGHYRLGVLDGDGIGPEIVAATLRVLEAARKAAPDLGFEWVPLPVGWEAIRRVGTSMPEATVTALETCDAWLLGPHDARSPAAPAPRTSGGPPPPWSSPQRSPVASPAEVPARRRGDHELLDCKGANWKEAVR